jgi:hypothetical protein
MQESERLRALLEDVRGVAAEKEAMHAAREAEAVRALEAMEQRARQGEAEAASAREEAAMLRERLSEQAVILQRLARQQSSSEQLARRRIAVTMSTVRARRQARKDREALAAQAQAQAEDAEAEAEAGMAAAESSAEIEDVEAAEVVRAAEAAGIAEDAEAAEMAETARGADSRPEDGSSEAEGFCGADHTRAGGGWSATALAAAETALSADVAAGTATGGIGTVYAEDTWAVTHAAIDEGASPR